ncbi:hypothetical protein ACFWPX_24000 [Nocardia sp. NPDC058518]|uniref:hypothetical protein n=1 Tax=Nocardia sp. NPDC058518 TaxID=3346534 RepID=UPI00364E128D
MWWTIVMSTVTGLAVLVCLWLVWQNMVDGPLDRTGLLLLALGTLGVLWLGFGVAGVVAYRRFVLVVVAPAVVAVTGVLGWSGVPERFGWWVSKPHFEQAAQVCEKSGASQRIGLYTVEAVRSADGGCLFRTQGGFLGSVGFAYLPEGAPPRSGEYDESYRSYDGVWYRYWI